MFYVAFCDSEFHTVEINRLQKYIVLDSDDFVFEILSGDELISYFSKLLEFYDFGNMYALDSVNKTSYLIDTKYWLIYDTMNLCNKVLSIDIFKIFRTNDSLCISVNNKFFCVKITKEGIDFGNGLFISSKFLPPTYTKVFNSSPRNKIMLKSINFNRDTITFNLICFVNLVTLKIIYDKNGNYFYIYDYLNFNKISLKDNFSKYVLLGGN